MKKNSNFTFISVVIFVLILVGGLIYLAVNSKDDWRIQYARQLELDVEKFNTDIESDEIVAKIEADIAEAESRDITGTPSVFINGEKIEFQSDFAIELGEAVDKALASSDKVLIEEFSDLQCPACLSFHKVTAELQSEYSKNDKITWTFRHFPLTSLHPFAYEAAIASEAAREQGKFDEMQDLLFNNQESFKRPTFE